METLQKSALVITIAGALLWGITGLFDYNVINEMSPNNLTTNIICSIIGVAGLINIGLLFRHLEDKNKIRNSK